MKKIKMIVTLATVLAIVGSALAFNTKKIGRFCVTSGTANVGCFVINNSKIITTGVGTAYNYVVNWNGSSCTTGSGCNTLGIFVPN